MSPRSFGPCSLGALALACAACRPPPEPEPARHTAQALNGIEGMFDYAVDLPWRMEPRIDASGARSYDRVPITISIHDEDTNVYSQDRDAPNPQRLGELCALSIAELDASGAPMTAELHEPRELAWIEVTGPDPRDPARPAYWPHGSAVRPLHTVCHPATEDCERYRWVRDTSEWHAQLLWADPRPWQDTHRTLELVAWVSRDDADCLDAPTWLALRTYARLNYADQPLPRFDDGWLYGDLHYHSQSTDNEGESGYAYRAVATTLAAMGVDFVFATDHASDSEQIVDVGAFGGETRRGTRDLTQPRWDAALEYLHGPGGANAEGAAFADKRPRLPRVFLGAEVDVMPELPTRPASFTVPEWSMPYGNGLVWNLLGADGVCSGLVGVVVLPCPTMEFFSPFVDVRGDTAYVVKDIQGADDLYVGRQHVLYVPRFRETPAGLVASRTTAYGGASRHLIEDHGVLDEIAAKHGLAFLAHPLAAGGGDLGPGMLPYSQYQYEKVFAHPALAGLQLWNEDNRVTSSAGEFGQTGYSYLDPGFDAGRLFPGFSNPKAFTLTPVHHLAGWEWTKAASPASRLHHGVAQWDKLLRWGLDVNRTRRIDWLAPGEPRRLFMAGGSDAHGDFNYRREGYMRGVSQVTDTAIARVRNLVQVGAPRGRCDADGKCYARDPLEPGHAQDQVAGALGEGRFAVTDGPALRIVVDRNANGVIDDADYPMGSTVELFADERLPLLVQATSTPEFGPIEQIDLYVGVDREPALICTGPQCAVDPADTRARTYGPVDHGARGEHTDTVTNQVVADPVAQDCGTAACQMADGYWLPRPGARPGLRAAATQLDARGVVAMTLDLDDFPTGGPSARATRVYVRAFARTHTPCLASTGHGTFHADCAERYAYANPIWALRRTLAPGAECPYTDRALDRDLDGVPDACDAFPDQPSGAGWTRVFGGLDVDGAYATAIDRDHNVWVAGSVRASGEIEGPVGGAEPYVASGDDAIVLKYSPTGSLLGKQVFGGVGLQVVTGLAIHDDDVFITGTTQGQTNLGGLQWTSDTRDPFVARLRRSDLGVETANRIAGTGQADGRAIAVGATGQVAVVGDFTGQLWAQQPTLLASGPSDCFVAFFSASTLQLQALFPVGDAGSCRGRAVAVDREGRTTAAYEFATSIWVSPTIRRANSAGSDVAIVRYQAIGALFAPTWGTFVGSLAALRFGGGDAWVNALVAAPDGGVYLGGAYTGELAVWGSSWPGGQVAPRRAAGGTDGYVLRLDVNGGLAALPDAQLSGPDAEAITGLAADDLGGLVVAGKQTSAAATFGATALARRSGFEDYLLGWLAPTGAMAAVRQMTTSSPAGYGPLAGTPTGDRVAFASMFAGSARFDDRRTVTSANAFTADGAVTLLPAPPTLGPAAARASAGR